MSGLERVKPWLVNRLGWSTNRKLLVIESDDWGSIRMASPSAFRRLKRKGYPVEECPFNRYDSLERAEDISGVAEVLEGFRDALGRPAIMTTNMVMANPDFPAIAERRFREYHLEPFWQTLERYGHGSALLAYREARQAGVFQPQLHGREHTAWPRWLAALRRDETRFRDAFEEHMYTVHPGGLTGGQRECLDALGFVPEDQVFSAICTGVSEGQGLFEDFWGERASSFIAPCYVWHPALEPVLADAGIRYLQGTRVQRVPKPNGESGVNRKWHVTGHRNRHGQRYLVRNVDLEPSLMDDAQQCLDQALNQVESAFRCRTPAIVSSHRLNYMGWLDAGNRDRGLRMLKQFLERVQRRWPEVEFIGSGDLGRLIET